MRLSHALTTTVATTALFSIPVAAMAAPGGSSPAVEYDELHDLDSSTPVQKVIAKAAKGHLLPALTNSGTSVPFKKSISHVTVWGTNDEPSGKFSHEHSNDSSDEHSNDSSDEHSEDSSDDDSTDEPSEDPTDEPSDDPTDEPSDDPTEVEVLGEVIERDPDPAPVPTQVDPEVAGVTTTAPDALPITGTSSGLLTLLGVVTIAGGVELIRRSAISTT